MEKVNLLAELQPEIELVDKNMAHDLKILAARGDIPPSLLEVLEHALFNGGKRIRPLLCVLAAGLCRNRSQEIYNLAIAFEYLHVATLIHDDVIDHAEARRGLPTVNKQFGLPAAILTGDFLHARSMFLVGSLGGKRSLELICNAAEAMVKGEFLQLTNVKNFNQSERDYFAVINGKTALFIGAICQIGGIFAGADDGAIRALKTFGANLGQAFQIQDDILDYLGEPQKTGKNVGNDFSEGKMTLPLIHTLQNGSPSEQAFLLDLLRKQKHERRTQYGQVREIITRRNGFSYSRTLAEKLSAEGIAALNHFKNRDNERILDILTALAGYIIKREK